MKGICHVSAGKLVFNDKLTFTNPALKGQEDKFTDAIQSVCKGDGVLSVRITTFIQRSIDGVDNTFINWLNRDSGLIEHGNKTSDNLLSGDTKYGIVNMNTFKSWISKFKIYLADTIDATATRSYVNDLKNYGSEQAHKDAIEYVGRGILSAYLDKHSIVQSTNEQIVDTIIWNNIAQDIIKQVIDITSEFASSSDIILNQDTLNAIALIDTRIEAHKTNYSVNRKKILSEIEVIDTNIQKLESNISSSQKILNTNIPSALKQKYKNDLETYKISLADFEHIKDKKIKELNDLLFDSYSKIYKSYSRIISNIYNSIKPESKFYKLRNQAALALNIIEHPDEVKKEVFSLSMMQGIKNVFNPVDESDKIGLPDVSDELIDNLDADDNPDSYDKGSQAWEDKLASDYKKFFGGNLYVYFNSIPKLNSTQKVDDDYDYTSDTELGTPSYYSAVEIINTLTARCPCLSVETFISAIERLSQQSGYEGFIKIADDMRRSEVFANAITSRFALNVARKDMINISPDGTHLRQSNLRAFPHNQIFLALSNNARNAYSVAYNINDASEIKDIISRSNQLTKDLDIARNKNLNTKNIDKDVAILTNDAAKFINKYFNKYFPDIDYYKVVKYLYASKTNKLDFITRLFDALNKYNSAISGVYERAIDERERVNKENSKIKKYDEFGERDYIAERKLRQYPNENKINFNATTTSLKALTDIFYDILDTEIELNSKTAKDNMSSDVIKNSYLTNFFKMLDDVIEESVIDTSTGKTITKINYRGAEILKEFLTKKGTNFVYGDNSFSTIIFGVKDLNGRTIKPGLFSQDVNGNVTITDDNIKIIQGMKYALFSGVKNQIINNGEEYDSMSARDYFVSTILAFTHPIDYNHDLGSGNTQNTSTLNIGDFANFMMRIPSDASNNYIIQMPKLNTEGRYNFDYSNEQSIISRYTNSFFPINNDLVQARVSGFYKDTSSYKINKNGVWAEKHFPNRLETFTEVLDFIDKVTGANITESKLYHIKNDTLLRRYDINPESTAHKQLYDNIIAQNPDMNGKNMILIPFVYNDSNNNEIVFWTLGYFEGNDVIIKNIQGIGTLDKNDTKEKVYSNFAAAYKNNETSIAEYLYQEPHIERHQRNYNDYSQIVCGFRQQLQDSVVKMVNGIQSLLYLDSDGRYKIRKDTDGLFVNYHYTKGSITKKVIDQKEDKEKGIKEKSHLELSGNIFNFVKLFDVNNYSAISNFKSALSLYGEAQDNPIFATIGDDLVLNQESNSLFILENIDGNIRLTPNFEALQDILSSITKKWIDEYDTYIPEQAKQYANTLSQAGIRLNEQPRIVSDAILNQTLVNMEFDDLFEGSSAFYKDAQTFLKRAKEVQSNGYLYMGAVDFTKNYDTSFEMKDDIKLPGEPENFADHKPIIIKNSFKAVTIANTYTVYDRANELRDSLYKELNRQGVANASELADQIAAGYGYTNGNVEGAKTCANDAQSYITLDEFIRRKWADGTISDYGDLLYKLKYNIPLSATEIKQVNQKIQAQKNVYYDRAFDENTNVYYSRFIKNAEIVLIPQFLPEGSGLRALYDTMMELGIDQVNTGETSKASNKNFATFFDENGATNEDGTIKFYPDRFKAEAPALVDTYFYRNLFKQQDVVDHIEDTENKAGIQIMKKIMDNAVSETEFDSPAVKEAKKVIQDNFAINIKNDFNKLLTKCGWIIDDDGRIVNKDKNKRNQALNITYFRKRFIDEAERLGLDPDFLNYLKVDETTGSFVVPTWLNSSADKMESIAQAIFNRNITRQTLPGFHAVQGSSVGISSKLHYYKEENGGLIAECKVPMWDSNIKTRYKELLARKGEDNEENRKLAKQELLAELNKQGLDRFIGYRIPTEGKQSLVIFKVVDFLDDNVGSTMIVPHEWVAQTGSDFDIDTIYAITYPTTKNRNKAVSKFTTNVDENLYSKYFKTEIKKYGKTLEDGSDEKFAFDAVYKEYLDKPIKDITESDYTRYISQLSPDAGIMTPKEFDEIPEVEKLTKDQRNTNIINAFMTIMSDAHSLEENASRSNFDDITKYKNENEALFFGTSTKRSTYNPFDQVKFMQNAIDGRKLKAFSVTRDTFNSINNVVRTRLGDEHTIKIKYNLKDYNIDTINQAYNNVEISEDGNYAIVTHDRIGNSINNRNVLGRLITPYSSQTTAHILDAIKEGALYNETDFTFKVFKTLVDIGTDYDTAIAFLMQPAITRINEDYEQSNSIFNHSWASPINNTILNLIKELGYDNKGQEITNYTNLDDLFKNLESTDFFYKFYDKFGINISKSKLINYHNLINLLGFSKFRHDTKIFVHDRESYDNLSEENKEKFDDWLNNALKSYDNEKDPYNIFIKPNSINDIVLDKEACKDRLRNSKSNTKENLFHDLGIALLYKKYSNTSQNIEDIARCVKPDSFGAKQTIHSTKTILINIANFINKEDKHSSTLITEDGKSILDAIYPNFRTDDNGHIVFDEDESAYKYLAYFLKYSTIPSVNVNSQIFDTEGPAFANYTSIFEGLLGRPLKDEEYKEFKKYIVSRLYYHDEKLVRPQTLDETNKIVEDNQALFNADGSINNSDAEIERKEIRRIFGYDEAQDSDTFTVKDKNNPTKEELAVYKTLTPLQKVNLIKRLWPDGSGIFSYITTNKVYANELKKQGYSKNVIRINTYKKEMSVYYDEFIKAISNTNPLVKLAAVDLVKYAYLVEGGRYRNNSITKTIPYEVIEADVNSFGMGLLYKFKDIFKDCIDGAHTIEEHNDLLDAFIRSHPNLLKNTWIAAPDGKGNIGDQFNNCEEKVNGVGIGLIGIPNEDSYSELIRAITRGNNSNYRYIRINHRNTEKGPVINTLYKVVPHYTSKDINGAADKIDKFYLIPLPLLDVAEGYEVSQNESYNNGYYSKEFYRKYVDDEYPNHKDIDLNLFKIITEKQTFSNTESVNSLQDAFDGKNGITGNQQTIAKIFVDRMINLINRREKVTDSKDKEIPLNKVTYVYTKNASASDLAKVFGRTKFARNTQQIIVGGRIYSFDITRVDNRTIKDINKATTTIDGRSKAIGLIKDVATTIPYGTEVDTFQIYAARLIPSEDIAADIGNQSEDGTEEDFSMFKGIYTDFEITKEAGNNIEENTLANNIAQEISRSANNPNNLIAVATKRKFYSKNIDTDSFEDIIKHEKDVYEIALEYYRGMAKNLLTQLDAFALELYPDVMTENKNFFSVDDPALYDILQKHPDASRRLYTLIVQCKYFGQNIKPILDNISTENETIKEISNYINSVTNNTKVNAAVKFIFNKYIAKEYSTNPMIKARVVDLLDSFGDIDWFDNTFADILHTNNKLIQVIVKLASEVEAKAEFDAKDKLKEFDNFINDLETKLGGETVQQALDKIIKDGKFIREFKQEWLTTKENLQKAENEALERFGKYSKEYLTAKLNKNIWFAKNVEQIGVEDYYVSKNNIEKQLLSDTNFSIYAEYLELQDRLNNQYGRIADLSDKELEEREDILNKLSALRSTHPDFNRLILDLKDLDAIYTVGTGTALYIANKTHMEDICKRIKEAHPDKDIFQLRADYPEFKNAYDWLKYNSPVKYGKTVTTTVAKWRSILADAGEKTEAAIAYNNYLNNLRTKYADYTDRYGNIDASKISVEELAELRRLAYERDNVSSDPDLVANSLIKVGQPDRILKREYYERNNEEKTITDIDIKHKEFYTKINNLLQKGLDYELNGTPHINVKKLADELTVEELTKLSNLYFELREFNKALHESDDSSQEESNSINTGAKSSKPKYNLSEYGANIAQLTEINDAEKKKIIKQILSYTYKTKKGKANTNPNFYIYGYMSVNESMIDNEKTLARINLRNNIRYVPNDYYKKAKEKAEQLNKTNPGAFNEWYNANHYYNPREHKYVPLEIWTTMEILPTSDIFSSDEQKKVEVPGYYDTDKTFKPGDRYTNKNFTPNGINYKSTSEYDNVDYKSLNDAEQSLYKRLTWYSDYYAHNYRQHKFNKEGFAPRDFKEITDFKWYEKQFLGLWGIADRNYTSEDEMKKLEYSDEFFTPYDMYTLLKTKDSMKEDELPRREDFDSEELYQKRLAEVEESNRKIREKNLEIDNSVLNKDWIQVYKLLIERGEIANAKYDMKDLLFLTLNTLKTTNVPRVNHGKNIFGVLSRDKINSTVDHVVNNQEPQTRAAEIFQSWMQKYLYGRFKTEHKMKTFADNLQAFTSAKYMMANIRGGIANVNTGIVNIVGEQLAGDAFNTKDFISAAKEYGIASVGLIADFFNTDGKASNEVSAICKLFDIVDLDEMMGAPSSSKDLDVTQVSEKLNSLLYGFMGGGEHFMQNSALLAMLNSHKVYIDPETDKYTIGTFEDYTQGIEIASFIDVIGNSDFIEKHPELENLLDDFNQYRKHIAARNKNEKEKHKFETLRRNIVTEFIRSHYVPRDMKVELSKLYNDKVKVNKNKASEKFSEFESVRSQLVFDKTTGTEVIRESSMITNKDLAELKVKAIYTNKKIHGVYDKMGAAQIEQKYWWGSLVMQYHKHLYPGYLKRWRVKGYYNEVTHTNEKGSRISLIDLLSAPFKGNIDFDANGNPITHFDTEINSDEKTGLRSIVALFSRLSDLSLEYAIYWNTMPEWEKRNLMRNLGDLSGIVAGLLFTMLLYALFDKQTMKNSKFINTGLYLADRLYSESRLYNIAGAYSEISTQMSQPVAAWGLINDTFKALRLVEQQLSDPDNFDPIYHNTQYKGQNKYMVLAKRNIPILRVIQRYKNVARNNNYFRINDNNTNQRAVKNIGLSLYDFMHPYNNRIYGANKVGENVYY